MLSDHLSHACYKSFNPLFVHKLECNYFVFQTVFHSVMAQKLEVYSDFFLRILIMVRNNTTYEHERFQSWRLSAKTFISHPNFKRLCVVITCQFSQLFEHNGNPSHLIQHCTILNLRILFTNPSSVTRKFVMLKCHSLYCKRVGVLKTTLSYGNTFNHVGLFSPKYGLSLS